jgi:effector-binding domain-containing protein
MPAYHVEKSIRIEADPQVVFETVADYGRWTIWSPWLIAEPTAKVTVSKNATSVGSTYAWVGEVVGQGELEHKKLEPGKLIEDELRFIKPFNSICRTAFLMNREADGTRLTWNMDASLPWFLFWMIPMMKTFIGMDYARGLRMLKELIENGKIDSQTVIHGPKSVDSFKMLGIASSCSVSDVGASMEKAFQQAKDEFKRMGLPMDGQMISVYTRFRMKEGVFEYISGYIVPASTELPSGSKLTSWSMKASRAFKVTHFGPYHHLGNAWSVANQHVRYKKMKQHSCGTYELYVKSPPETSAEEIETEIYLPLKS